MTYKSFSVMLLIAVSAVKSDLEQERRDAIELKFHRSKNCEDFPDGKVRLSDLDIEQIGRNKLAVSGILHIREPLSKHFKLKVRLTKCPSAEERGMCEHLPPVIIEDFCKKFHQRDQIWSDFVRNQKHFEPHCPIPQGHYNFHRHEIDLDSIANMPLMEGYWILKLEGYKRDEKVMCEKSEILFTRRRRRHDD